MLSVLISFVVVLTVIVFVHEMGHFLIARHNGVKVSSFSIGFGPELFGWTDKKGTRWKVSGIPMGGYVMMAGDADATSVRSDTEGMTETEKSQTLMAKTPWQRIAIAFGGPLFNILFSLLVFFAIALGKGIPDMIPRVEHTLTESLAEKAGLQQGDIITAINGEPVPLVSVLGNLLNKYAGTEITLAFKRLNEEKQVKIPLFQESNNGERKSVNKLGIELFGDQIFTKTSFGKAVSHSFSTCFIMASSMLAGFGKSIQSLVTRKKGEAKLGGFLTIADQAHKSLAGGMAAFITFMAMLSLSLAIFNLLPIPVLDGGSIFLGFVEIIRGKPISPATIEKIYTGGLIVVGGLMLWALWNDVTSYGIKIWESLKHIFHSK